MKYAKLVNNNLEFAPQNKGSIINYNLDVNLMLADGYKPFTDAEEPDTERMYHVDYTETEESITKVIVFDETEEEFLQRKADEREAKFNQEFFLTSLGYIRRQVHMQTGETKDFLSDLLPTIALGVNMGQQVPILAYSQPDFSEEINDWTQYQHVELVTPQFIQECFLRVSADFGALQSAVSNVPEQDEGGEGAIEAEEVTPEEVTPEEAEGEAGEAVIPEEAAPEGSEDEAESTGETEE